MLNKYAVDCNIHSTAMMIAIKSRSNFRRGVLKNYELIRDRTLSIAGYGTCR